MNQLSTTVHDGCVMLADMTPEQRFAERLKMACAAASVPPEPTALARRAGMKKAACHKYLHGQTTLDCIPASVVYALADALRCNARWLFLGDGGMDWTASRSLEETELLHCMRNLSPERRAHVLDNARAQLALEAAAPATGRFSLVAPSTR